MIWVRVILLRRSNLARSFLCSHIGLKDSKGISFLTLALIGIAFVSFKHCERGNSSLEVIEGSFSKKIKQILCNQHSFELFFEYTWKNL